MIRGSGAADLAHDHRIQGVQIVQGNPDPLGSRGPVGPGNSREILGENLTQRAKRGRGDNRSFRAQEAFNRVLFEKHLFSGIPETYTLRQKGHLSLAYTQLTPRTQRVNNPVTQWVI